MGLNVEHVLALAQFLSKPNWVCFSPKSRSLPSFVLEDKRGRNQRGDTLFPLSLSLSRSVSISRGRRGEFMLVRVWWLNKKHRILLDLQLIFLSFLFFLMDLYYQRICTSSSSIISLVLRLVFFLFNKGSTLLDVGVFCLNKNHHFFGLLFGFDGY